MAGLENVLPAEIRPPRTRAALRRDMGATFYRSPAFFWTLLAPPALFGFTVVVGRLRERWGQDTERGRRRKTRRLIRHHLRAAEAQLEAGTPGGLLHRDRPRPARGADRAAAPARSPAWPGTSWRRCIAGSGLRHTLARRGCWPSWTPATGPASRPAPWAPDEMRASLERAAELILQIEKAPQRADRATT